MLFLKEPQNLVPTNSANFSSPVTDPVPFWEQWLQNQYSDEAVNADRAWAEAQAKKQMDFQERLSNTSYQRVVADLTKAGLNPALAYFQEALHPLLAQWLLVVLLLKS